LIKGSRHYTERGGGGASGYMPNLYHTESF
jgi:hypothetical protein